MKHELLAPAGNLEAGYAALYYGADAVYLGLTKFSARAGAENFTAEELDEFTAYAHTLNKKVFVTLNTILTETELNDLPQIIQALKKAKVDAVIIQDLGIFYLLKRLAPEIELHASTQMAVHNVEGARFLHHLGFKRVVLARELTLAEIRKIAKEVPDVDLEVFVHGALCYAYSGQCLFSALEYGKSANRGRCVYPCRAIYSEQNTADDEVENLKGHLFSMKDLALEEHVLDIPALSLKIEGRKKSPLYVAAVTNYYRHILDGKKKSALEAEDIKQIFSRPWCKFHFNGRTKDITDEQFVGHRGLVIGKVENVRSNHLIFKTARDIARYDGLQIDSGSDEKPFGFAIKSLFVNRKPVFEATAGQVVEVELPDEHPHLSLGAPVYLASSSAVKGKYHYTKPKAGEFKNFALLPLRIEITAQEIWAMSGQAAVSVTGEFTEAKDISKTEAAVHNAFAKTLDAGIKFTDIEIANQENRFTPLSLLNELRRKLVEELLATGASDEALPTLPPIKPYAKNNKPNDIKVIPLSFHSQADDFSNDDYQTAWFQLPQICRDTLKLDKIVQALYAAGARKFMVENYYGFELLKKYADVQISAGSFIYVMNRYAAAELKEIGVKFAVLALESSADNMSEVLKNTPLPLAQVVSARPPLFTSAVCIRRNDCAHCKRSDKTWLLKSGGHEYLAVSKDCQLQLFDKQPYERTPLDGAFGYIKQ